MINDIAETRGFPRDTCREFINHQFPSVFGLPDLLSFLVREHAMVASDRGQIPTGTRQGQTAWRPGPPSRKCNVCKNNATKAKTREIKSELVAVLRGIDAIGGHAKPN